MGVGLFAKSGVDFLEKNGIIYKIQSIYAIIGGRLMKVKVGSIISLAVSILLTGILPSLLTNLVPIPFTFLAIIICVFLVIIFSLIQVQIINKTTAPMEEELGVLKQENTKLKQQNEQLNEELSNKEEIIKKYTCNSYAATGIVFNSDYTKVLLAYHERQKRWIPPGSHIDGVEYFHDIVLRSATRETGYRVRFHESHDYEKYTDANCCVVPCPFSVQIETQIDGEGHGTHYDALYILIADENEEILKPGTHKTKWLAVSKLEAFARRNNTYPDVVQSVNDALRIIHAQKGGTQSEDK